MVLQRHVPIPVWGTANPGHVLSVQLGDEKGVATADQDGKWKVVLPATEAGGPFELAIKTEGEIITITDVLMVKDWRTAWDNEQLPFLFVQLPRILLQARRSKKLRTKAYPGFLAFCKMHGI